MPWVASALGVIPIRRVQRYFSAYAPYPSPADAARDRQRRVKERREYRAYRR
jgi:hypothetical protein